jgi:transposase
MSKNVAGPLVLVESTMNSREYKKILEEHLLPFAKDNLSPGWFLYQDNSPIHKSKLLMGQTVKLSKGEKAHLPGWFAKNQVSLIKAPPYSPDLNVIENLWAYLKAKLRGNHFRTKLELWYYMRKVWRSIRREILQELVDSMPRRIKDVISAKGGPTKY